MQNEDLKKIKELLEIVKHKVDTMETTKTGQSAALYFMRDQQSVINEKLDVLSKDIGEVKETQGDHTKRLEALVGDVHDLQDQIKALDDKTGMYHARNKREVDEIKEHLNLPIISDRPEI